MTTKKVHTFCRICEPACGLLAEVENEKIVSLQPDKDHPVHKGFSCNKGVQYLHLHNDPDRMSVPLQRTNSRSQSQGEFEAVGWDQALSDIGTKIAAIQEEYGNDALAIYSGNPAAFNSNYYTNVANLLTGFQSSVSFSPSTQDCSSKFASSEVLYGSFFAHPIPDLCHTHYFLGIGCNPAVSHMSLIHISNPMAKLRDIKTRGGKVLFVNPRKTESSTTETGETLLIKPDTDVYFLAAILNQIIFHIGYDEDRVLAHAKNIEGLKEFVARYPADRVAQVTGISADDIRDVSREFCAASSASIHMSTGVNMGRQGALAYWMLNMISLFSGNLGKRGGNIYQTGFADTLKYTKYSESQPFFESRFGEMRKIVGAYPANLMSDILDDPQNPVRALLVIAGNPLLSVSGEKALRQAFNKLELIVVIDLYRSTTAEMADYILPAKDFLEREDLYSLGPGLHLEPYVQYTPAVVPAAGERREEWWILSRILQEMGRPSMLDVENPDPFTGVNHLLAESDLSVDKLKTMPCQTAVLPEADPADVFKYAVLHDDGLIDCCPEIFARGYEVVEQQLDELLAESREQLKLITRRTPLMINSWMNNLPELKKGVHQTNPLWINSSDAAKRGFYSGERVSIKNQYGAVEAEIVFDDSLSLGVVAMSHGWGQQNSHGMKTAKKYPGANINRLSPIGVGSFDILSNQSHMTGINVEINACN